VKRIIAGLVAAVIAATLATATNASAQRQTLQGKEPLPARGPPAPSSDPTYLRPGISGSPIPSHPQRGSLTKPATPQNTVAPLLPPVQAFE
jgi:hypothetical protein